MEDDPIDRQKDELNKFNKKYYEVDPEDHEQKQIYLKEIDIRKKKIEIIELRNKRKES